MRRKELRESRARTQISAPIYSPRGQGRDGFFLFLLKYILFFKLNLPTDLSFLLLPFPFPPPSHHYRALLQRPEMHYLTAREARFKSIPFTNYYRPISNGGGYLIERVLIVSSEAPSSLGCFLTLPIDLTVPPAKIPRTRRAEMRAAGYSSITNEPRFALCIPFPLCQAIFSQSGSATITFLL